MAPKRKAAAPTTPPLDSCVFAFHGNFVSLGHTQASLEKLVRSLGGSTTKSVAAATTHLVCTPGAYDPAAVKVYAARQKSLPIVMTSWIEECSQQQKTVDISGHLLGSNTANGSANGTTNSHAPVPSANGVKHSAALAISDDDDEPQPKKTKRAPGASTTTKGSAANNTVDNEPEPEVAGGGKVVAEGQFIKKKGVAIPLDENCPFTTFQVYVDPDSGMIYDASLNQTNATRNNNKFYRIQVIFDPASRNFRTWTRWGRVGELGQTQMLGDGSLPNAIKSFEKKFRDKSGLAWAKRGEDPKPGKYAFVERSYNPDSDEDEDDTGGQGDRKPATNGDTDDSSHSYKTPECTLEEPIKELMELIFNQQYFQNNMAALNYDSDKMPLGKLSKATISRGFQQLKTLAELMDDPTLTVSHLSLSGPAAIEHVSNAYYSLIPHAFGRHRPPIIRDSTLLKKEIELLESLSDMKDAAEIMKLDRKGPTIHPLDSQFQGLGMQEITTLDPKSAEFTSLERYLNWSRGATHHVNYEVEQIFRIERSGEAARFDASPYAPANSSCGSDRRLLWHGSRCTNFGGILSQGLRIAPPEAPVSGYMFGKGIYLADMSSKSAGYCAPSLFRGQALLLLCDAELGNPMQKLTQASYDAGTDAKKQGLVSTWGQGSTGPSKWTDASVLHENLQGVKMPDTSVPPGPIDVDGAMLLYNEYICYDVAQVRLRYLFRVNM